MRLNSDLALTKQGAKTLISNQTNLEYTIKPTEVNDTLMHLPQRQLISATLCIRRLLYRRLPECRAGTKPA